VTLGVADELQQTGALNNDIEKPELEQQFLVGAVRCQLREPSDWQTMDSKGQHG
jgi:hypothetical protein